MLGAGWSRTPSARPARRRDLDAVVGLSDVVAEAGDSPDPSTEAFLDRSTPASTARAIGSERSRDVRRRPGAHRARRRRPEFDTVVVAGAVEGNFPSLSRPEPMFDLAALERPISRSERNRARLEDERRLFRMVLGRARTAGRADRERDARRRRTVAHVAVRRTSSAHRLDRRSPRAVRRAGLRPGGGRHVAPHARRPGRAARPAPGRARRSARARRRPGRWWFQRDWTDTGAPLHETVRVSYSKLSTLENCELQYVLSATSSGLGGPVGYQAWVGKMVHKIIEDCENGKVGAHARRACRRGRRPLAPAGVPVARRLRGVPARWSRTRMLPNWFERFGECPALAAPSAGSSSSSTARRSYGVHRPDRADSRRVRHAHHRLQDRQPDNAAEGRGEPAARHLLPGGAGIARTWRRTGRCARSSSRSCKGHWTGASRDRREWQVGTGERGGSTRQRMRERLSRLIAERTPPGRGGGLPAEPAGRLLLLRLPDALLRSSRRARRCSRRTVDRDVSADAARRRSSPRWAREPTDEQWRAISLPLEPYVLVAGAGSGKTSVMAARVVYLALAALGRIGRRRPRACCPATCCASRSRTRPRRTCSSASAARSPTLDLAEGEEPEILNYHGFAASCSSATACSRASSRAQRVLTPAQRTELCARVLDRMTFEHVKTATWQPSLIANILELDEQAQNHLVTPDGDRRLHRGATRAAAGRTAPTARTRPRRSGSSSREAAASFRELKRELGVIDFGDQIALRAQGGRGASRGRRRVPRSGSAPCCSTSTRTRTSRRRG